MLQKIIILLALIIPGHAISSGDHSNNTSKILSGDISFGLIKRDLIIGKSTQEDVIRRFGSPNNMVLSGGGRGEMWIYDRIKSESALHSISSSSGIGVGIGGSSGGIAAGTSSRTGSASTTTSVRTLTVILDFDPQGILKDISARQGSY